MVIVLSRPVGLFGAVTKTNVKQLTPPPKLLYFRRLTGAYRGHHHMRRVSAAVTDSAEVISVFTRVTLTRGNLDNGLARG